MNSPLHALRLAMVLVLIPSLAACASAGARYSAQSGAGPRQAIHLVGDLTLSPDGKTLVFAWRGDLWSVSSSGGDVQRLTQHAGDDRGPRFSPDGRRLAFSSNREGSYQVYLMPATGGAPEQVTWHTAGYAVEDWFPDGESLMVSSTRDHFWRDGTRFFRVKLGQRVADELLFDAAGKGGRVSPDGGSVLFVREDVAWWRKGYVGSQSAQIWKANLESGAFEKLVHEESGARTPLWMPDGGGFYYTSERDGSFDLWARRFDGGSDRQLTHFEDDVVVEPVLSRDGSTLVFRHLFDLYRLNPRSSGAPEELELFSSGDTLPPRSERRNVDSAAEIAFSADGLEVAFVAGGDLWVMDTELREPKRITDTPEEERSPVFAPDGESLVYVSESGGRCDLWQAVRGDTEKWWWQNQEFPLTRLTDDEAIESSVSFSPGGERVAFVKGLGDLWTMELASGALVSVLTGWDAPQYDWSPDGAWFVYVKADDDFNNDVWLLPSSGEGEPFNLSRHPDNESGPVWSPDGRMIAFTGRRTDDEVDVYYAYLRKEDDEKGSRDRKLEKALEKMKKVREKKKKKGKDEPKGDEPSDPAEPGADPQAEPATDPTTEPTADPKQDPAAEPQEPEPPAEEEGEEKKDDEEEDEDDEVVIDFEGIHDRLRRLSIPDSRESNLFWSHDSKKLAFGASIDGKRGTYTVEFPDELEPKLLTASTGGSPRWIEESSQILWLAGGKPTSVTAAGKATAYDFDVRQEVDLSAHHLAGFELAWRTMRDNFYDERLGNRDWDAVRAKYAPMAAAAPDGGTLATVVNLMLGELNGSHLGFFGGGRRPSSPDAGDWREETAHLGVRFVEDHAGPGLLIRDVLPDGPAELDRSRLEAGETLLAIDGVAVAPGQDLTEVLNGPLDRELALSVRGTDGEEREVLLRPISQGRARSLLYDKWVEDNQAYVERVSEGRLGYLHVRGMNWSSFLKFEEELYAVGAGRDGLVIDVRENGGGSTADHLLTALTQPRHAITVPRGGGQGYPHDRKVYATWNKPIVVLCNQNSFSNAEIFSHAVKTLGRGKLVGVRTAGGVISTGGTSIMDLGFLRLPFRGWFLVNDGEDMELNGAVPDFEIWPEPGEWPAGRDLQMDKAIEVLEQEVREWAARPRPALIKATERPAD